MENELYHYGILGMRWGIRRYQNKDGTLTAKGKKRYNKEMERLKKEEKVIKERERTRKKMDALETKRNDLSARKKIVDEYYEAMKKGKKTAVSTTKPIKKASEMSNEELQNAIRRKQLEIQYNQYYNSKNVSAGKAFVKKSLNDVIKPALINASRTTLQDFLIKEGSKIINKNKK